MLSPEQISLLMEAWRNVIEHSPYMAIKDRQEGKMIIEAEGKMKKAERTRDGRTFAKYAGIIGQKIPREPSKGFDKKKLQKLW